MLQYEKTIYVSELKPIVLYLFQNMFELFLSNDPQFIQCMYYSHSSKRFVEVYETFKQPRLRNLKMENNIYANFLKLLGIYVKNPLIQR